MLQGVTGTSQLRAGLLLQCMFILLDLFFFSFGIDGTDLKWYIKKQLELFCDLLELFTLKRCLFSLLEYVLYGMEGIGGLGHFHAALFHSVATFLVMMLDDRRCDLTAAYINDPSC